MSDGQEPSKRSLSLSWAGAAISAAYLIFLVPITWSSWSNLWALKPNEFGDLMAGTFAPLAFLWLVLGFFQQGQELRASVRALELQGEELRNSVEQQKELVKVASLEFEHLLARGKVEEREAERAAQPNLTVSCVGMGGSEETGWFYTFRLRNHGPQVASSLILMWHGGDRELSDTIEVGETIEFQLNFLKDSEKRQPLRIGYIDIRGNYRRRDWTVILYAQGEVSVSQRSPEEDFAGHISPIGKPFDL